MTNSNLAIPLLGLIAGIVATTIGADLLWAAGIAFAAVAIWLSLVYLSKNPANAFRLNGLHYAWIFLLFLSAGITTSDLNRPGMIEGDPSRYAAVTGNIVAVKNRTSGDVAEIQVRQLIDTAGRCETVDNMKVMLRTNALQFGEDDRVCVASTPQLIREPENWFGNGNVKRLNDNGIFYELRCDGSRIEKLEHNRTLAGTGMEIRNRLERFIENTRLSKSTQNFLITVLLGDRNYLDNERRELFADAGISHILALSGMHVGIIAGIALWLLFPINFIGKYKLRLIVTTLFLIFYAFITGMSPTITRATLMTLAVLAALLLERKNNAWNSLLLATLIILVFTPNALFDIGMQLSFVCVASLIIFVNRLNPIEQHNHPALYKICAFLLTSLVATICTWCLAAWYFGRLPLMFLPANIIALPLLPAFIGIALLYLFLAALGWEPMLMSRLLDGFLDVMQTILGWLTNNESTVIEFSPTLPALIIWFLLVVGIAVMLQARKKKVWIWANAGMLALFLTVVIADADRREPDAFIMQSGNRKMSIHTRLMGQEETIDLQRHSIGVCTVAEKRIIWIDCAIPETEEMEVPECDYLLIGSGNRQKIEEILAKIKTETIVIHPSVHRKRESEIIETAEKLNRSVHSIRNSGPLRVENVDAR